MKCSDCWFKLSSLCKFLKQSTLATQSNGKQGRRGGSKLFFHFYIRQTKTFCFFYLWGAYIECMHIYVYIYIQYIMRLRLHSSILQNAFDKAHLTFPRRNLRDKYLLVLLLDTATLRSLCQVQNRAWSEKTSK